MTQQLSTVADRLRRLAGTAVEQSDEQLLDAFARRQDERAFAVLVDRHASLVMGVCRRALGQEQDAEDAFQAAFLVFTRKASTIRRKESLTAWLHGVSNRIAMNAKRSMTRRKRNEQRGARPEETCGADELSWREVQALLDEEVQALPDIYRRVFVLCCLQDVTRAEAASQLGLKEGTVASRLSRARVLLQERFGRRGVTLSVLLAAVALAGEGSRVSGATIKATVAAAVAYAAGVRSAISPRVVALAEGCATVLLTKAKVASSLVLLVGLLAGAGLLFGSPGAQPTTDKGKAAAAAARENAKTSAEEQVEMSGRVVAPDGAPIKGALVEARLLSPGHSGAVKLAGRRTTGADGRFRLVLKKGETEKAFVVATAAGFGLEWVEATQKTEEVTLKLATDQAISAEIVDLEGRPVKDARIRVVRIDVPLEADLAAHFGQYEMLSARSRMLPGAVLPEALHTATTDARGRLRLAGLGRERLIVIVLEGPTIASSEAWVMTRQRPLPAVQRLTPVYAAAFRHPAAPTRLLTGVVRDRITKKPLAGVTVRSEKLANQTWYGSRFLTTRTDGAGRFRLVGLPTGKGNIVVIEPAVDQPCIGVQIEVADLGGTEPVALEVGLLRGVWAEGQVTDEQTGRPVAEASVQYYAEVGNPHAAEVAGKRRGWLHNPEVRASPEGRFRLPVLPGKGIVAVRGGREFLRVVEQTGVKRSDRPALPHSIHLGSFQRLVEIEPKKEAVRARCDAILGRGETLQGKLVDPEGKEVQGAWACGARTGWDGWHGPLESARFTLSAFNRKTPRFVAFLHPERNLAALLLVQGDGKGEVVVRLQKAGTLKGQVVDIDGKPKVGLALDVFAVVNAEGVPHMPWSIRTDAAGRFQVGGFLPGMRYWIGTGRGGSFRNQHFREGETKDLGAVQLND
jgi:RNA polymerase sigma factor (sigma-70 family)